MADIIAADAERLAPRAGFWRRALAFFLDCLVIAIPMKLVAVLIFTLSGGVYQVDTLLKVQICRGVTLNDVPEGALSQFSEWRVCKDSLLGLTTALSLSGYVDGIPNAIVSVPIASESSNFNVMPDGTIDGDAVRVDLDLLELIMLMAYCFMMERGSGQTLGKRVAGVVVHDRYDMAAVGLPWRRVLVRQLWKFLGMLSVSAFGAILAIIQFAGWLPASSSAQSFASGTIVLLGLCALWYLVAALQIVTRQDTFYDRPVDLTAREQIQ